MNENDQTREAQAGRQAGSRRCLGTLAVVRLQRSDLSHGCTISITIRVTEANNCQRPQASAAACLPSRLRFPGLVIFVHPFFRQHPVRGMRGGRARC